MKKFLKLSLLGIIFLSLLIGGCGKSTPENQAGQGSDDSGEKIELKFSTTMPDVEFESHPAARAIKSFIDNVENKSEGKVEIKLYTGGQLSQNTETDFVGMQSGSFQFTNPAMGSWGEYTKAFMPFNIAYLFKNEEVIHEFLDGDLGNKMREDALKDTNIRFLAFLDNGFRHITNSKREIKTPEDMQGIKIRTMQDPYQIKAMEALGASPTPLAYSELYTALQQGVVDAQENPLSNIYQAKFYEVQKYLTLSKHNFTLLTLCMSNKKFESLPQDIQEIIVEEAKNAETLSRQLSLESQKSLLSEIEQKMQVYDLTQEEFMAFQEKAKTSWDDVKEAIGEDYYNQIIEEVNRLNSEVK
ncbi:MAG: TRAP transporter substrate-binding protein [Peptococcaceae bacterium]